MTKVLAYCAFLNRPGISLPEHGLGGASLYEIAQNELRVLWSEVEWPFDSSVLQRYAVEFHKVVSHMFSHGAVVPFRLLSVFDDKQALTDFVFAHHADFSEDLKRLQNLVQMECVLYFKPQAPIDSSGTDYLHRKAELLRGSEAFVAEVRKVLSTLSHGLRTRESKNGSRIFVLLERGNEHKFHSIVQNLPVPERLSRRLSGPWPAAEFLSEAVKVPNMVGQK